MASLKLSLAVALLLCDCAAFMVMGFIQSSEAEQEKVCTKYCLDAMYIKCPSTGNTQQTPACFNCCLASEEGCIIYFRNGEVEKCT